MSGRCRRIRRSARRSFFRHDAQGRIRPLQTLENWSDLFSNGDVTNIVNFYSTQEEVVCNGDGLPKSIARAYSWYNQEYRKGDWTLMNHLNEGGWAFNRYYDTVTHPDPYNELLEVVDHKPPDEANALSDFELRQHPFFHDFANSAMYTSPNGVIVGTNYLYRAEMLAYASPSESFAVGANPLPGGFSMPTNGSTHVLYDNYDMATLFTAGRDDLPENHAVDTKKMHRNWQHSTFVQRSYKRVHQLFETINQHIKENSQ